MITNCSVSDSDTTSEGSQEADIFVPGVAYESAFPNEGQRSLPAICS